MKTLLALLLLIPSLSFADKHPEKDTSLYCLKEPPGLEIGDYPFVGGHAWWLKIYGGENYLVDAFRIQMTGRDPEFNKLDGNYLASDLTISFKLPHAGSKNNFMIDRVSLELTTVGVMFSSHLCIIIDDAYTEAKGTHTRLLELYLKDQAKLKSERKL